MSDKKKSADWCANGRPGYDIDTGKPYNVSPPCQSPARPGHIYCDRCRVAAGGRPR
jgi:hypothetical protein